MILYQVTVYHNNESRFTPSEDGHRLTATVSHWRELPDADEPEVLADWAYKIFNADLDHLQQGRTRPDGELAFLAACVYRLLWLRSPSVGDVVEVAADTGHWWLAYQNVGWKRIDAPSTIDGQPLTAEKVYAHLRANRTSP